MAFVMTSLEGSIQRVIMALLIRALRVSILTGFFKEISVILFFQEDETCVNLRRSVVLSIIMKILKGMSGKLRYILKLFIEIAEFDPGAEK